MKVIDIYYLFGLIFSFVIDEENKMIMFFLLIEYI